MTHPASAEECLAALETALDIHRFDKPLDDEGLRQAQALIERYTQAGGDLNALYPETSYPTPVWLSWLIANEKPLWDGTVEARRERLAAALAFIKGLGKAPAYKRYRGGGTAFSTALHHGAFVTAALLVEDGFDLGLQKLPPVFHAMSMQSARDPDLAGEALLALLLQRGGSPNEGWNDGASYPLAMACERSLPACIRLLLEHGADPNIVDKYGATPIMHCIDSVLSGSHHVTTRDHEAEMVELLLRAGAHVDARTSQNRTFHSMVESACDERLKAELFALVDKFLGSVGKKPAAAAKTQKAPQLLTDEQIGNRPRLGGKQLEVEWIVGCFQANGVKDFVAGSVTAAFQALKIDRDGEGAIVACPKAEAEKILAKLAKAKKPLVVALGDGRFGFPGAAA